MSGAAMKNRLFAVHAVAPPRAVNHAALVERRAATRRLARRNGSPRSLELRLSLCFLFIRRKNALRTILEITVALHARPPVRAFFRNDANVEKAHARTAHVVLDAAEVNART